MSYTAHTLLLWQAASPWPPTNQPYWVASQERSLLHGLCSPSLFLAAPMIHKQANQLASGCPTWSTMGSELYQIELLSISYITKILISIVKSLFSSSLWRLKSISCRQNVDCQNFDRHRGDESLTRRVSPLATSSPLGHCHPHSPYHGCMLQYYIGRYNLITDFSDANFIAHTHTWMKTSRPHWISSELERECVCVCVCESVCMV